jgi:drug/metabolite transporter (DMT)-like permease
MGPRYLFFDLVPFFGLHSQKGKAVEKTKTRGILILIFIMIVWGSSYALTKSVVEKLPPMCFAFIRFLVASLCLLPVYLQHRRRHHDVLSAADYIRLTLMGLTGVTGYYVLFNFSLLYTTASVGALIQGLIPILIALFGVLFLGEKVGRLQICGIIISFVGVAIVGLITHDTVHKTNTFLGNILMVGSVICWTVYTLLSRKSNHLASITTTFLGGCAGTALLLPMAVHEYARLDTVVHLEPIDWMVVFYLGAVSSALCYLLYNKALQSLPAALVGNFLNLDILVGVVIAVLFLHETISTWQIVGAALILSGLFLSSNHHESSGA